MGEKFSKAAKHELSEDFKILEDQTETRKEGAEAILDACLTYLKTLEKRTEAADKGKHLALQSFGLALMSYGSDLDEESLYGPFHDLFQSSLNETAIFRTSFDKDGRIGGKNRKLTK